MIHLLDGTGASSPWDLDLEVGQLDILDVNLESAAASIIDQKSEILVFSLFHNSEFWALSDYFSEERKTVKTWLDDETHSIQNPLVDKGALSDYVCIYNLFLYLPW